MSNPKTHLPQWAAMPIGPLYHGLYKIYDEDRWSKLRDPETKKTMFFTSSITAANSAKAYLVSLQPKITSFKKPDDEPMADLLGVKAFYANKAVDRARAQAMRKNKKFKPFEVEVKRNGKKTKC